MLKDFDNIIKDVKKYKNKLLKNTSKMVKKMDKKYKLLTDDEKIFT